MALPYYLNVVYGPLYLHVLMYRALGTYLGFHLHQSLAIDLESKLVVSQRSIF